MTIEYNLAMSQSIGQHPDLQSIRLWITDPQHIKKVEALVEQHYANQEVLQHLLGLIATNTAQYSTPQTRHNAYQSYGCILNRMLAKFFALLPTSEITALGIDTCFKLLFTWDAPHSFKQCLVSSFVALLNTSKTIIGEFFEDAWGLLVGMAAQLDTLGVDCPNRVLESRLVHQAIGVEFVITLPSATSRQEVFHTVILLGQCIFLRDDFKENRKSQERLIEYFKKIHQMLFKQSNIDKYVIVFRQLFSFWRDFNSIGLDRNKSMKPAFESISRWGSFLQDLELLLNYKASKDGNNCSIYFMFTDDLQSNNKLVELKKQAFDVFNDLLEIVNDALHTPLLETPFGQNIGSICQSVVASLECLAVNKQIELTVDIEDLTLYMLSTIETTVYIEGFFHQATLNHILFRILLPMINAELQDFQQHCKTNDQLKMMLDCLNDCCQQQQKTTILSISCKILQQIVGGSQLRFIIRMNSFIALIEHLQLAEEMTYQPEIRLNFSVPMAFLMLSLLQFSKQELQLEQSIMKIIIAPEKFKKLSAWNRRFCFLYVSHNASIFEDDQPKLLDFYIHYCIDHPLIEKDPFLYDLLVNICPHYSSQQTAEIFYSSLTKADNLSICNQKCSIFSIIIKKHLKIFSQDQIVTLIQIVLLEIRKRVKDVINRILLATKYQQSPAVPFGILTQISFDFEYVRDKPKVISALYSAMDMIEECCKVNAEDMLVQIVGNLIEATRVLPDNFDVMLAKIKQAFQGSEFTGASYYHLFGQTIDVISSYINDNTNEHYRQRGLYFADKMFEVLMEGFSYFVTFPDERTKETYASVSHFEVIYQKMLILLGDTLPKICIKEIKDLCDSLLGSLEGTRHSFLKSRTQNLRFICEFLSTNDYRLQEILKMVSSLHYSCSKDVILFTFLAGKIRAGLPQSQQLHLVLIILYNLQSNAALKNASVQLKQIMCKQNSIFNYIHLPFDICNTPLQQARAFFAAFEEEDPEMKAKIMGSLNREIYANLSHTIELIFKQDNTQAEQFNEEIQEMTSAQLDEGSDSDSYYSEEEDKLAKRRIVRVIKGTSQSAPRHQVNHQIIAKKRQFQREDTDDIEEETNGEVMQTHRKRRKIEEMQPERIKKDIMREKRNRKVQRL